MLDINKYWVTAFFGQELERPSKFQICIAICKADNKNEATGKLYEKLYTEFSTQKYANQSMTPAFSIRELLNLIGE